MSILVNRNTKVITQGITGKTGQFHTRMCRDYANGRNCFVAGVNPKKAGEDFEGIPIYATVSEAKAGDRRDGLASSTCRRRSPRRRSTRRSMPASISSSASPKAFRCAT